MEQWKTIEGYEQYEVSSKGGLVRNRKTGRIKRQRKEKGYLRVELWKNGKRKVFSVHRLVAQAFIPNPDNLDTVDHIDHNRQNNDASNLRWMSHENNCADGSTPKKVYCVELDRTFNSVREAGKETGANTSNIIKCCKGKRNTAGKYHWKYV